jgi:hypothetical protein
VSKVLVVVEENHSLDQMSAGMPYTFGLAKRFGYATHYTAIRHPSLPNYVAIAGGGTFGIADDAPPADHPIHAPSVFGRAIASGHTAALYAEGMPRRCAVDNGGGDRYAVKHNPWAYFVDERTACDRHDLPAVQLATAIRSGSPAQRRHGHPGPLQRRPRLRPVGRRRVVPCRHAKGLRRAGLEVRPARGRASPPTRTSTTTRATRCSRWCCTAASRRGWSTPR